MENELTGSIAEFLPQQPRLVGHVVKSFPERFFADNGTMYI